MSQDADQPRPVCHYCGLENPGPEHSAYAPSLCAEHPIKKPDQPRPVWLSREQRDWLAYASATPTHAERGLAIVGAWDAAPADAHAVVLSTLDDVYGNDYIPATLNATHHVLRDLGMPDPCNSSG